MQGGRVYHLIGEPQAQSSFASTTVYDLYVAAGGREEVAFLGIEDDAIGTVAIRGRSYHIYAYGLGESEQFGDQHRQDGNRERVGRGVSQGASLSDEVEGCARGA